MHLITNKTMNTEIIGKNTIGQLIGLYNRSAERCKSIVEALDEIRDAMEAVSLAESDLRYSIKDKDEQEVVDGYKAAVEYRKNILNQLIKTHSDFLQVNATIISDDTKFGARKINV